MCAQRNAGGGGYSYLFLVVADAEAEAGFICLTWSTYPLGVNRPYQKREQNK